MTRTATVRKTRSELSYRHGETRRRWGDPTWGSGVLVHRHGVTLQGRRPPSQPTGRGWHHSPGHAAAVATASAGTRPVSVASTDSVAAVGPGTTPFPPPASAGGLGRGPASGGADTTLVAETASRIDTPVSPRAGPPHQCRRSGTGGGCVRRRRLHRDHATGFVSASREAPAPTAWPCFVGQRRCGGPRVPSPAAGGQLRRSGAVQKPTTPMAMEAASSAMLNPQIHRNE
ncbi:hypothetical protein FHX37_1062 [Haloactinospora alba]|uniref:Uncharacterized protein n=1 Tax=Haloactinospora alba TaxID=405555 RepID=A0A543NH86_9ACTN|nr:hypothetical protein FHX37_1062 [Haloactinospora alba]